MPGVLIVGFKKEAGVIRGKKWLGGTVAAAVLCLFVSMAAVEAAAGNGLIKFGMRGDAVGQVQERLREIGYYEGTVDSVFGSATRAAVLQFQQEQGLVADGVVGSATLQAMKNYRGDGATSRRQSGSRQGEAIVARAKSYLGVPYVWGGTGGNGFDCSGFIWQLFSQAGVSLPRMADEQFYAGYPVQLQELQPGDVVFFTTYEPGPSHAGVYLGNGSFIHASSAAGEVTITPLSKAYYAERYLGARRMIQ